VQEPDLIARLKHPEDHYEFTDPKKANAVLMSLCQEAADALAAPVQELWEPSDTAHRPGGLPQDFTKHEVDSADAWSEWVCPAPKQYFMKCCDCGLVHEMQFKVAKYSEGNECEFVKDADLQAVFRARRTAPPAARPAIPDALTSADIEEHIEYVAGWNECRQAMMEMMK
jgi:hypothetical protein